MATQNDFSRSFGVTTAMSAFRRVSMSSNGQIQLAGSANAGVGILQEDTLGQSYENPKVRFYGTGSCLVAVTGINTTAATAGAMLYCEVTGYVSSTGTVEFGFLISPASLACNGAIGEVLPQPNLI